MLAGLLYAIAAGLLWGLIFIGPLLVPDYPAALQSTGRYLALGLVALPLAWQQRRALATLSRRDWQLALLLALIGNLLYYCGVAGAVLRVGAPIATMVVGTLPVVIALAANFLYRDQEGQLRWPVMSTAVALMLAGLVLVNLSELKSGAAGLGGGHYLEGLLLAFFAVACWSWYALKNARWLRTNPRRSPAAWATAQGLATLPLSVLGFALASLYLHLEQPQFPLPLGPRPGIFVALMLAIAVLCSWLGTLCWNAASQRLPTVLMGPMAAFEILTGLGYSYGLRGQWPDGATLAGVLCMVLAVVLTVAAKHRSARA